MKSGHLGPIAWTKNKSHDNFLIHPALYQVIFDTVIDLRGFPEEYATPVTVWEFVNKSLFVYQLGHFPTDSKDAVVNELTYSVADVIDAHVRTINTYTKL